MADHAFLTIENISRSFGTHHAVDRVSLEISAGEIFSLLGPSGCGKTTLLRLIAGFEQPDAGRILLDGQDITALPPERRPVNTVFQNYALFPHLSARENIAFGPRMAGRPRAETAAAVADMLEMIQMTPHAEKKPAQLSGGQRQRIAIARALVNRPRLLLLDEPLAALDLKLRQHLLTELRRLHAATGTTFIYVTHDQGEALSLSDRVAVMHAGRVEQVDTPRGLYQSPRTTRIAAFVGDACLLPARVLGLQAQSHTQVHVEGLGQLLAATPDPVLRPGEALHLMLRPERLRLATGPQPQENAITAQVTATAYHGPHQRLTLQAGPHTLTMQAENTPAMPGDTLVVTFAPEDARLLRAAD